MPRLVSLALACVLATHCASAAVSTWTGAVDTSFANAANWNTLPADDLLTDLATFTGTPSANQPRLTASRSLNGLVFSTPTGGWTLSAASPALTLSLGASGLSAAAQSSGTNTVSAALTLAATQTFQIGTGGTLNLTGSLRAGTSLSPLAGQLVVGGSGTGDMILDPAPGQAVELYNTIASAASLQVNRRLVLGSALNSTASINTVSNATSAGIRISDTGLLEVRSGEWRTNDLGSNNTSAFTGTLNLLGGTLATGGARYLGQFNAATGTTVNLSGGTLLVTGGGNTIANSGHLGLGAHGAGTPTGTVTFNVSGGTLDIAKGSGNLPAGITSAALSLGGIASTSVLFNQSGGTVRVGLTSGSHVFTGTSNTNTFTNLSIGSTAAANQTAYTLSGGTLLVAGNIQGVMSSGGTSNFNFLGGTLAPGTFVATNLGHSPTATATSGQTATSEQPGTLVNRGGTLAPGGVGTAGKSVITGNYSALPTATLALDLGGTTQATTFQHSSGTYDTLAVSGTTTLGGQLSFSVLPGFTPASGQTFTVLTSTGTLSGAFTNAASGARILSTDGLHTFVLTQSASSVTLGNYLPVLAPVVAASSSPAALALGDAVVLSVTPTSLAPVTYEWRREGVLIPGATSGTLTLTEFQAPDAGRYEVTLRNAAGSVTRTFFLRVTTPPSAARITLDADTSYTFNASPASSTYSWILDGEEVGTSAAYTYAPARREVGTHWLRVVETYPDATTVTRHWTVRVRIPLPASTVFYHVAPGGVDTNPGTSGAPFLTLEKARDVVRALSPAQKSGGVTIYLRGGIHRRTTPFILSASDSGTASAPIVYAAFPGETPVLTSTRVIAASQWSPLASSEVSRVAPGVDATRIWELDVTGNTRAASYPAVFNEWTIFNALRASQNGGSLEVFRLGERQRLSRYPNVHPTNDTLTPNLAMNGVAAGADYVAPGGTATGYLNGPGTYTRGDGTTALVGAAFQYAPAEAARIARWQTAISRGGLWIAGYWRVPWQLNVARVGLIDPLKNVIGFIPNSTNANTALISNGIGDKYNRPAGSKKEPWWALNLLEEIDQPGEWSIDFSRQRLYFLMDRAGAPADGEIELSDVGTILFQLNGASDVRLQGLTFRRHLGINVQILNGTRNLLLGCTFTQSGNMAVDINGGTGHGVLSSDFEKLASGGVMLRGGSLATDGTPVPADHFAVNNRFRSFGEVVRVYQAAIDVGYGGPMGSWGVSTVGMRVAHNDLRTSPHAGILWNGHRHVIEYNEVSDFTRISNDLGAIYRFGRNADFRTVIRYNHLFESPLGEGVYNDMDHVRTPVYGNTINLKTPATAQRGYGFWSNTHTTSGEANTTLPMGLQVYNNVLVNTRSGASFHSATGGRIENNISYRPLSSHFLWYRITNNTTTNTHVVATSNAATLQSGPNLGYASDPGFIDYADDDLRLRPDATVYRDLPGFVPVPLELAGLRPDETRATDPSVRVWTPFIVTGSASSVGANTATFTGTLIYPQFDANATVRLYWGTTDGGDDPAAWQRVVTLGQPDSGHLSHTPADLAPATRYYFRFHAVNTAGEHWSEETNSTTTLPLLATPTTGPALASSANPANPATLAFDGSTATVWRTATGVTTGTLQLAFPASATARVTRYEVVSAPDSPARDPRDWRLEGSADGLTWVVLDTRTAQVFTTRSQTLTYGFINPASFATYRLVVTANNGDATSLQLAELRLYQPDPTPDTTGPVITTPGNLTVPGTGSSGAFVTFDVSAVDALTGNATATASPPSGSLFPIGQTTVTVSAADAAGNASTATFVVQVTAPTLSAPWTLRQINPYTGVPAGTATVNSPTSFTIAGSGGASTGGTTGDLWTGNNDSFTYVSQPWSGDGVFTARVAALTSTDASAKAGIIFRETTSTGSRYSAVYLIRNNGGAVSYQHKTATSGASTNTNFFYGTLSNRGIPEWIRLVRKGDTFTTFWSDNGLTWTEIGSARSNILGGSQSSVGLCVVPRTGGAAVNATFDNISFSTPLQAWRQTHFATPAATGTAADAADPDGDTYPNLLEYALGTLPLSSVSTPALSSELIHIEPEPAPRLTLTFPRIADPALTYAVEAADTPAGPWSVIWSSTGPDNTPGDVVVVDATDLTPSTPRRFLRLRITSP